MAKVQPEDESVTPAYPAGAFTAAPPRGAVRPILGLLILGAAVSVALGVYGNLHEPRGVAINVAGFSGPLQVKVWLTTGAFGLALVQLLSAFAMYGKVPGFDAGDGTARLHRWSGRLAFLLTVPVAMHCLYALGFQDYDTRTMVHSLLGCAFFGAFTAKMLSLTKEGMPGWLLPLLGGTVFALLTGLWLSSAYWFFSTTGVQF
jgi:hypothetical protein